MNVSVLIALRDSSPDRFRERQWAFVRGLFEAHFPGFELVVEPDDGEDPFHKTLALNRAAARASGDIFWIQDVDTWCPSNQVRRLLDTMAQDAAAWGRPYHIKVKLNALDSAEAMERQTWDGQIDPLWMRADRAERLTTYWAAPPHLMRREHFYEVGQMDTRLRGWGQEDEVLALSLKCLVGKPTRISGYAIHLWHPRLGRSGRDRWSEQDTGRNARLATEYQKAQRNPAQMRALIDARNGIRVST